jgi:hypothetical protein
MYLKHIVYATEREISISNSTIINKSEELFCMFSEKYTSKSLGCLLRTFSYQFLHRETRLS